MIKFDALDFSECRSEEVVSYFWCSLYMGNSTVTELQIRDYGLFFNHFVFYSYDQ